MYNNAVTLDIGFSPCPNDTFIFDAMVNGHLSDTNLTFDCRLEDVETLNQWAFEGKLAITKLSYNTILQVTDKYQLLNTGSALGSGVGPLLITTPQNAAKISDLNHFLQSANIAIPGKNTTANLLFTLAFPNVGQKEEVLFSEIEQAVLDGKYDGGLVIHESRFTYHQRGLHKLMDMGEWWEKNSEAPIPLGGICIRRDVPKDIAKQVEAQIAQSVQVSWHNYPQLSDFVTRHAQEMDEAVMRQHINLYVNEYTSSLGIVGRRAIDVLFNKAIEAGIIQQSMHDIYF